MFRFFRGILLFGPVFALGGCQPRDTSPTVEEDTSDSVPIVDADSDGYTEDDCDDGNADVHPGATEPRCENDIDDDCDGEVDEFPLGGRCLEDVASTSIQELTDGHGDGGGLSIGGDIDGDGRSDLLFSGGGGISPPGAGHVHLFLAANLGTGDVSTAAADWTLVGDTLSYAGSGISGYSGDGAVFLPDLDGDGLDDVVAASDQVDDGVAYVVAGVDLPGLDANISAHSHAQLVGTSSTPLATVSLAMGDLTGDSEIGRAHV